MIKQHILTIVFILCIQLGYSQILIALVFGDKLNSDKLEFGMNVGANYSSLTNVKHTTNQIGLNLGMTFVYKPSDKLHINPALYFSYPMGANGLEIYESPDSNLNEIIDQAQLVRQLSYFSLPITIRYRLFGKTFIEAGPQISLLNKASDVFTVNIEGDGEMTYKVNLRDYYKLFDAGITAGFTQKLREQNGISLSFKYYYGLMDISKNSVMPDQHNSVFYFSCGIPIGGNKKGKEDKL